MNSENPLTPREELEVRLTALLLGELSAEEAATFEEQIARDPELAATHARLRQAIELLREATAIPELTAHPAPATLSTERRQKLFQHFSNAERGTRNAERSGRCSNVPRIAVLLQLVRRGGENGAGSCR